MAQQTDTSIKLQDAYDVTTSKFTGIDIFSGAGGLSLGAEMAGVNVKYAVESGRVLLTLMSTIIRRQKLYAKTSKK